MKQLSILELENPANFGNRDVVRANAKRDNKEVYNIPVGKIKVVSEYNPRQVFTGIEELALDIDSNGQESPGTVIALKDGSFALIKGERRYRALKLLASRGIKKDFKAFLADRTFTLEDHYYSELSTQHTDHLKPAEVGDLIQRLLNMGKSQKEIATRAGRSQTWVSNAISFARESEEVKEAVNAGKISVSTVLQSKKEIKNQSDRTEKIKEASKSEGKVKVSDLTGTDPKLTKAIKIADAILEYWGDAGGKDKLIEIIKNNL